MCRVSFFDGVKGGYRGIELGCLLHGSMVSWFRGMCFDEGFKDRGVCCRWEDHMGRRNCVDPPRDSHIFMYICVGYRQGEPPSV